MIIWAKIWEEFRKSQNIFEKLKQIVNKSKQMGEKSKQIQVNNQQINIIRRFVMRLKIRQFRCFGQKINKCKQISYRVLAKETKWNKLKHNSSLFSDISATALLILKCSFQIRVVSRAYDASVSSAQWEIFSKNGAFSTKFEIIKKSYFFEFLKIWAILCQKFWLFWKDYPTVQV